MNLKKTLTLVVLGFVVMTVMACSPDRNKPLDPPFQSLIPSCEYFVPLFDKAEASMITSPHSTGALQVALRRCSGNHKELIMRLSKFSDSAESSRYIEEMVESWNRPGRQVRNLDYSYRDSRLTTLRTDFGQLDGFLDVDMGFNAECPIRRSDKFFFGQEYLRYIQVGSYVGEYVLKDCAEDKHLKAFWSDFSDLAARLGKFNPRPLDRMTHNLPSMEEQILEGIAIDETAARLGRLTN